MDKEYVSKLEGVIRQMLTPLKGLRLDVVIQALCGHKVIPFDPTNQQDIRLLDKLKTVAAEAA